ncbi:hypothetical protein D3C86_964490 [compost metagenome]
MELHGVAEFLALHTLVFYETNYSIKMEYLPSCSAKFHDFAFFKVLQNRKYDKSLPIFSV